MAIEVPASLAPSPAAPESQATPVLDISQGLPNFELFDIENKAAIRVPREQAADLLRSGLYAPKKGTYQLLDEGGEVFDVESHALQDFLQTPGTRFETSDEQRRRENQEKYGHQSLRTFAESAGSAATFGLSTQAAVKGFGVPAEDIQGRREANPAADVAGEITGVAAPLIASMGSSALAKGASKLAPGLAAKAGGAVEKQMAKTFIAEGASPTLAQKIVSKLASASAGSAVEGGMYGAGTLLDENALGRADINAENFLATVGPAALMGAGAGAALKAIELGANPIMKFSQKQISAIADEFVDKNSAALELLGVSGAKSAKLKSLRPELHAKAADYLKNDLKYGFGTTVDEAAAANQGILASSGQRIGRIIDDADAILAEKNLVTKADKFWSDAKNRLVKFADDLPGGPGTEAQRNSIIKLASEADELAKAGGVLRASDVHRHQMEVDGLIQWGKQAAESPLKQQALRDLRSFYRDTTENMVGTAEAAGGSPGLLKELQDAKNKFSMAKTFEEPLNVKAEKGADIMGLKTLAGAGILGAVDPTLGAAYALGREVMKSDLKRKAVVLLNLEKAAQAVNKTIDFSVKNFAKGVRTLELPVRTTIQSHMLSKDLETNKKASDKQQAMRNVQNNLIRLTQDQASLAERINKATATMYKAAPQTSVAMDAYSIAAANFLTKKLPKKGVNNGVFAPFKPPRFSDMEIHKFEKYLEAVETPLKVIKKLEHGQINREHVEALKEVYPQIYQRLQSALLERVSNKPESFSYNKKIQLSLLLGQPTDASLQPENIAGLQATFVPEPSQEQSGGGAVGTSQTGLGKLDFSGRTATDTQDDDTLS